MFHLTEEVFARVIHEEKFAEVELVKWNQSQPHD